MFPERPGMDHKLAYWKFIYTVKLIASNEKSNMYSQYLTGSGFHYNFGQSKYPLPHSLF